MKRCAALLALLAAASLVVAAAAAGDETTLTTTTTSRRALKELHLPAIVSTTGKSEVVGKGKAKPDALYDQDEGDETLSTGITKSLIRKTAVNNVVIVTWANNHYRDFARFWISRLRALGIENFMVSRGPWCTRVPIGST